MTPKKPEEDKPDEDIVVSPNIAARPEVIDATPQLIETDTPDMWTERCLISLDLLGYGQLSYESLTESIVLPEFTKDVDFINNLKGGQITKLKPAEANELKFKCVGIYPTNDGWPIADASKAATGLFDIFAAQGTTTTGASTSIVVESLKRIKVRATMLWTNEYAATSAADYAITAGKLAMRLSLADGYLTKIKPTMTADDGLEFDVTLKFPHSDINANGCVLAEEARGTYTLTVLAAYTTANKFR